MNIFKASCWPRQLSVAIASVLVGLSGPGCAQRPPLGSIVPQLLREGDVPGLAIAVVENGRVVAASTFGVANGQIGQPVRDDTIFEAASLSKPVVAYAFLKLVDQGRFGIDDPIANFVDGGVLTEDPRWSRITFRMLLSHTAGLPNELHPGETLTIGFQPGTRFSYSGIGYSFLQQAIERATGQDFEAAMESLVFRPLRMADSSFVWRPDYETRKAAGHSSAGIVSDIRRPVAPKAPSSLHTTARDYGQFLAAILRHQGLTERSWAAMTTPQVRVENGCVMCIGRPVGPPSEGISWGLGWGIETVGTRHFLFHWGENNGDFQTFVMGEPDPASGLVALTNSGNGLSIIPAITLRLQPGPHPAFAWMGYDRYDSPARIVQRDIIRLGAAAVITRMRVENSPVLTESQWNRIGYQLLARRRVPDAVMVFERGVELFPQSANAYDSLAEAYLDAGRRGDALRNYQHSLMLDPRNDNARGTIARIQAEHGQ